MRVLGMSSTISRKRVAVSSIASTGTKKRKVEVQTTLLLALPPCRPPPLLNPPRSTVAVTTAGPSDAPKDTTEAYENLEQDTMGASWRAALEPEFTKPYFLKVCVAQRLIPTTPLIIAAQGFLDSRDQVAPDIPTR